MSADLYAKLAAPFDETFKDNRGGAEFTYITGEAVTTRLNDVLGVAGWSFKVLEHGMHAEADEAWVLGELTADFGETVVTRQQFGSQKVKRSRAEGKPLDIGFDLKGAATDAMKKCAMLLGVGLYLAHKQPQPCRASNGNGHAAKPAPGGAALICDDCQSELSETKFRDGTAWTPAQLQGFGKRKHSRTLCMGCYKAANDAKKRTEASVDDVPF